MSQDQFNKNEKFPRFQPNRDDNNKKGGPKFSNYWIWAILLATVIGFSIYGPFAKRTQPITVADFKDLLLRVDIDPSRGFIVKHDFRACVQPVSDHNLLVVAARQGFTTGINIADFDTEVLDLILGKDIALTFVFKPAPGNASHTGVTEIVLD